MNHEKVIEFLKALKEHESAEEMIRKYPEPETAEDRIRIYAQIAGEMGHDVSEEDLKEYVAAKEKHLREKAEAASEEIQELPADDLSSVAGGKGHSNCKDTYKDKENCWVNDACDIVNHHYKGYQCHYNNECAHQNFTCGNSWYEKCGYYYYYG